MDEHMYTFYVSYNNHNRSVENAYDINFEK